MSALPVSLEGFTPPAVLPDAGTPPLLQWIAIKHLVIDPTYQRAMLRDARANVVKIARDFDWSFFAPVVVSPVEGGKFAIIDGQHRTTAAALIGKIEVPCCVIIADLAKQARAFSAINGNITRVHLLAVFHAAVTAGDPDSVALKTLCAAAGVRICAYPVPSNKMRPGDTLAVGALKQCLRTYGAPILASALAALVSAAQGKAGLINQNTIKSFCLVAQRLPMSAEAIAVAFAQVDLQAALKRAADRSEYSMIVDLATEVTADLSRIVSVAKRKADRAALDAIADSHNAKQVRA